MRSYYEIKTIKHFFSLLAAKTFVNILSLYHRVHSDQIAQGAIFRVCENIQNGIQDGGHYYVWYV